MPLPRKVYWCPNTDPVYAIRAWLLCHGQCQASNSSLLAMISPTHSRAEAMPPCCAPCVAPFVRTKGAFCLPTHMVGQATSFTKVAEDPLNAKIYRWFSSPPTTFQVVSRLAHRFETTGAFVLRLSCDLKRRMPRCGSRVHVAPQLGHSIKRVSLA